MVSCGGRKGGLGAGGRGGMGKAPLSCSQSREGWRCTPVPGAVLCQGARGDEVGDDRETDEVFIGSLWGGTRDPSTLILQNVQLRSLGAVKDQDCPLLCSCPSCHLQPQGEYPPCHVSPCPGALTSSTASPPPQPDSTIHNPQLQTLSLFRPPSWGKGTQEFGFRKP